MNQYHKIIALEAKVDRLLFEYAKVTSQLEHLAKRVEALEAERKGLSSPTPRPVDHLVYIGGPLVSVV